MEICSVDGCSRPRRYAKRGWCQTHYHRWWRTGSLDDPVAEPTDWWKPIGYRLAHTRVAATFGPAKQSPCIACGGQAREWAYDGTDPESISGEIRVKGKLYPVTWSRFPEFYMPMCFSCHRMLDRGRWSANKSMCAHGHDLAPDNVYTPPGSNSKECRQCRRLNAKHRMQQQRDELRARGLTARGTKPVRRRG